MIHQSRDAARLGRRILFASCCAAALAQATPAFAAETDKAETEKETVKSTPETLPEVVVTAPSMDQPLLIETDTRNPRTPIPPADGAGYLKNIPGFSVARQGAVDGDPILRGQGGSRLNVLLDGAPLLGGCPNRMDPPTAYIFPDSFDKLTVLKGPQSVVNGGSALGTVLIEREPPRFAEPTFKGSASALYGSHDRNDEAIDAQAGASQGFVRAGVTHSSSDDYRDGNGDALHSRYWRHSGTLAAGWTPDADTMLRISYDKSQAQAAMPGKMMDGTQFDRDGVNLEFSKTNLSPLLSKIAASAYYNYVDHVMDIYSMRYNWSGMGGMTAASQVDHLMQGGKLSGQLTPDAVTLVDFGVEYGQDIHTARSQTLAEYRAGTSLESKARVRDLTFDTYAAYAEATRELSQTAKLIGGYRLSVVQAKRYNVQPNLSDTRDLHSGFLRYEQAVDLGMPVTLYAGLGHAERAPDYWERNKTTTATTFGLANERTDQLDAGMLFRQGDWKGSASLFYAYSQDYILVAASSAKNVDAQRFGGEAEISYKLAGPWSVEATAAYVHGRNLTDNVALAQTPPLETSAAVKYDDGEFMGGLHLRAVAGQHRIHTGWGSIIGQDIAETGGFAVLSANLGWRFEAVTLTGGIDNILDKTYAEHVSKTGAWAGADLSAYNDTVKVNEPGRTFWMRGSVKF